MAGVPCAGVPGGAGRADGGVQVEQQVRVRAGQVKDDGAVLISGDGPRGTGRRRGGVAWRCRRSGAEKPGAGAGAGVVPAPLGLTRGTWRLLRARPGKHPVPGPEQNCRCRAQPSVGRGTVVARIGYQLCELPEAAVRRAPWPVARRRRVCVVKVGWIEWRRRSTRRATFRRGVTQARRGIPRYPGSPRRVTAAGAARIVYAAADRAASRIHVAFCSDALRPRPRRRPHAAKPAAMSVPDRHGRADSIAPRIDPGERPVDVHSTTPHRAAPAATGQAQREPDRRRVSPLPDRIRPSCCRRLHDPARAEPDRHAARGDPPAGRGRHGTPTPAG